MRRRSHPEQLGDRRDVPGHGHVREQARLLDDVTDAPPQLDHIDIPRVLAEKINGPGVRFIQPIHHFQQGGFAGA